MNKTIIDYILKSNRIYSQNDCFYLCSRYFALKESNCMCNSTLSEFDKNCLKQYWEPVESDMKKCVAKYLVNFRKNLMYDKCNAFCPLECDSISYTINFHNEYVPINGNISEFVKKYFLYFKKYTTYEEINKHFVGLRVFYKDLKYTLISQEPKTETFNFISDIGGILGLFLGISFLSFVEIIEIIFEIFLILIYA